MWSLRFLQSTNEFVFLVTVKITAKFQRPLQGHAGTMEPYFDVVQGQAEDVCNL
jgi:hypothetical protein